MTSAPCRVVVTGGAGSICSTLTDRLLSDGWEEAAVDGFGGRQLWLLLQLDMWSERWLGAEHEVAR
jgi:hypothetical protein